jgi:Icc-related predicted phosphoesterase
MLKLFFASDVHGSDICWKKFLKVVDYYKVDLAILGGDLTGKMVVPFVKDGTEYAYSLFGRDTKIPTTQLDEECLKVSNAGYYPYPCEKEEVQRLSKDEQAQTDLFNQLMAKRMQEWVDAALPRFKGKSQLYVSPGNDDRPIVDEILEKSEAVVACERKLVHLPDGYDMVTCGWVNPTPWKTARETPDEKIEPMLEELMRKAESTQKLICNFHAPPYNSGLDTAPKLTSDFSVKVSIGGVELAPMGSKAVRKMIEKYKPLLGLHGHIHESAGFRRFGRTLCVNPGSEYAEGVLRGYLVFLSGEKVQGHWRVAS